MFKSNPILLLFYRKLQPMGLRLTLKNEIFGYIILFFLFINVLLFNMSVCFYIYHYVYIKKITKKVAGEFGASFLILGQQLKLKDVVDSITYKSNL